MKKIFHIIAILITTMSFAQTSISLENTYVINSNVLNPVYSYLKAINTQQGIFYYTKEYINGDVKITIYDQSHNFYKTFNLSNVMNVDIYYITDKLFNSDNLMEFLIGEGIHTKLINENGVLLYTWADRWSPKLYKDNNNNYKLVLYNHAINNPSPITSDVYALGGTLSLEQQELYLDRSFRGYPNPTENKITISNGKFLVEDTKLEVFDANGKKIFEKAIMSGEREIIFDTSSYNSGTYIYKINGESHKFIKK